jgi:acetyl-CoA decarbonylase/synthase, CODH/ACS complex subunit delta
MAIQLIQEKWSGSVSEITIGATKEEGGSRAFKVKIGGERSLPFLFKEGVIPNKPYPVFEVWDIYPKDWPKELIRIFGDVLSDPFLWADKCIKEYNAKIICLRLKGAHPELGNKDLSEEVSLIKGFLSKFDLPLIILGCGDDEKDNFLLPACSEAAKNERCLIGNATQNNYKAVTAGVLAGGHSLIAESPIDINIAKQLNILISDMGMPLERIVIDPTIGALGYGLEYAYSIMERARLAALSGDKTLFSPFLCLVGQEAWRAKEAKVEDLRQGIMWEILTALALVQAGANLLVMRHPIAVKEIEKYINSLCFKGIFKGE